MEMLHKHPESGDILNLQDAKFFLGRKKPQTIISDIGLFFFFLDYLDEKNFEQMNLQRKFGSCAQVFKNYLKKPPPFFSVYWMRYT